MGESPIDGTSTSQRHIVAGLPVADVDLETVLSEIASDARSSTPRVYVLVNAHSALLRRSSPAYTSALSDSHTTPLADGASMTMGARLRTGADLSRCPGPDLMDAALSDPRTASLNHFFVCATESQATSLADAVEDRYPDASLAGTIVPPMADVWPDGFTQDAVEAVRTSGAQVVWVGVSAPKQEVWSVSAVDAVGTPMLCVGAALDFLTATKPRAPRVMRRLGLEWLFRLVSEPRRLWHRYLVGNSLFVWDLLVIPPKRGPR